MATQTSKWGFIKPELTDSPPDITALNANWDKLDETLGKGAEWIVQYKTLTISERDWIATAIGNDIRVSLSRDGYIHKRDIYEEGLSDQTNIRVSTLTDVTWINVVYGNGVFVALSNSKQISYSYNGISWIPIVFPTQAEFEEDQASDEPEYPADQIIAHNWLNIVFTGSAFVVASTDWTKCLYSYDGVHWNTSGTLHSTKCATSIYCADGLAWVNCEGYYYYSRNGDYFKNALSGGRSYVFKSVAYDSIGRRGIAIDTSGVAYYSSNGYEWKSTALWCENYVTITPAAVSFADGMWVVAASNGDVIVNSNPLGTWTLIDFSTDFAVNDIAGTVNHLTVYDGKFYVALNGGTKCICYTGNYCAGEIPLQLYRPLPDVKFIMLKASAWEDNPIKQEIYVKGMSADWNYIVDVLERSDAEHEAASSALIKLTKVEFGYMTFRVFGDKPNIDLVIMVKPIR